VISVEAALARVLALATPLEAETVDLSEAAGRWICTPVVARRDQPPFAASAMDGYAVAVPPRPGARLMVIGEAGAGHGFAEAIGTGQAVRIFTGAPVPVEATHVVLQEDVEVQGNAIILTDRVGESTNIRPQGQDFRAGKALGPRRLRPNDLALLAAMNVPEVRVTRRPVVALIATGDELVLPGEDPGPDQIICSNTFALKALVEAAGAEARMLPIARDTESDLRQVFALADGADMVVTVGGASVGDHDLVARVAGALGLERAFYKISMRPGKPLMAGRLAGVPMLGLPGNPVSAIVCGHLFVVPLIRAMLGDPAPAPQPRRAVLTEAVGATGPRTHYMRARLVEGPGLPGIAPFAHQDSALLGVLAEADALLIRPLGDGARQAGEQVFYHPL